MPGDPVCERNGLPDRTHRVETPLHPGTKCYCGVRMRHTADGCARATRWSASGDPRAAGIPAPRNEICCARIVGHSLVPCGCLDDIPAPNHYPFRTP